MTRLVSRRRHQKAVLWAANGFDNYGEPKVHGPVEIAVRWEEEGQEALDAQGNNIAIDASVVVDREIPVGSIMWLGRLRDVADPPVNLNQVVSFNKIPDVKGRTFRRTALLIRYSDALPSLA